MDLRSNRKVDYLLGDFLQNRSSYEAARDLWARMVEDISQSFGHQGDWISWGEMSGRERQSDWDLYPIIGKCCKPLEKAFRISQFPPEEGHTFVFGAWLSEYEEEWANFPRHELFMSLTLSQESIEIAGRLLKEWMDPATPPESVAQIFATIESEFGSLEA